jgi:hypothetical protein
MQSLGTLPDLGVSWSETTQFNKREILALEALHLQYLFVEGTPSELNRGRLRRVSEMANALHTYIDAAVIVQDDDNGLNSLFNFIAKNEIPVVRLRLFPAQGFVTNRNILETAQSLLSEKGMSCQLGGGSRAYFAQFNRASLPLELMDFTTFSVTPQVHMFDNVSVMETIQCQYQVVSDARRISKGRSVVVGPITLRSHFDSNAAATVVPPFDARQKSLFAAAWLVGSIQSLTAAGASAANYFELTGREGVMDDGGAVKFPVYYVLKTIGDFSASTIFGTRTSHPQRLAALGMAKGFNRRVMVANLTNNLQIARIRMPEQVCANISVLDETTYLLTHRRSRWIKAPKTQDTRDVSLALLPYAIAHVDWVSKD